MPVSIIVATALSETIAALFPGDERGHISFGFAGRTVEPQSRKNLVDSSIRVRDYMMERFVVYSISVEPSDTGTEILIQEVTDGREPDVEWFAKKYIESKGIEVVSTSIS